MSVCYITHVTRGHVSSYDLVHIYVTQRFGVFFFTLTCKLHFSLFFFSAFCFRLFRVFFFSNKSLPAARKGMERRKRGFSRVSGRELKTVK